MRYDTLWLCDNFYNGHFLWISLQALSSQLNVTLDLVGEMGVAFPAPSGTPHNQGPLVGPSTTPCSKGDQTPLHWKEAGAHGGGGPGGYLFPIPTTSFPQHRITRHLTPPPPLLLFFFLFQDSVTYYYAHNSTSAGPPQPITARRTLKGRGGGWVGVFNFEVCTCISMWRASK